MRIREITVDDAKYIAHRVAVELMDSLTEPMPPFETRHPGKLESCLAEPFKTFDGKFLHRTFTERAAVLFYLVTKKHCFINGNKRMAVTLTSCFFYVNRKWLNISPTQLYKLSCSVAESNPKDKDKVQKDLTELFKKYLVPRPRFRK